MRKSGILFLLSLIFSPSLLAAEDLLIIATDDAIAFLPERLTLTTDDRIKVTVEGEEATVLGETIFVKRNGSASFSASTMQIVGEKAGVSELYIVRGGNVFTLPLEIKESEQKAEDEPVAQVDPQSEPTNADHFALEEDQDSEQNPGQDPAQSPEEMPDEPLTSVQGKNIFSIKVFDDRSDLNDKVIYPAGEVLIEIPALNISLITNLRGEATVDLPLESRFMAYISDKSGRFMSTQKEIFTSHADDAVIELSVMRYFNFSLMNSVSGAVQHANRSSLCGVVKESTLQKSHESKLAIELDRRADGPYYFNQMGFIDLTLRNLGKNGRFCFFNVDPGLGTLNVLFEENAIFTQPHFFDSGYHQEQEYRLSDLFGFGAQISVQSDADTYMRAPEIHSNDATGVVDVFPFGLDLRTRSDAGGVISFMNQNSNLLDPRLFIFVDEPDLTPTVYQLAPLVGLQSLPVLPVYPRGFVEDLALRTDVVVDDRYGNIVAHYRYGKDAEKQRTVTIKLADAYGRILPGQYFSTYNEETAFYINVVPGYYQMIATETGADNQDRVIDIQSVFVYSGALTSVVSGLKSQ